MKKLIITLIVFILMGSFAVGEEEQPPKAILNDGSSIKLTKKDSVKYAVDINLHFNALTLSRAIAIQKHIEQLLEESCESTIKIKKGQDRPEIVWADDVSYAITY